MRIKLETLELKLTQITTNANATITNTSLSASADNSAAELSGDSWSVIDPDVQSSTSSSSDTNQRQNGDGKHAKGQQRRKRRNRKQRKQNKQSKQNEENKDQSVAMQMSVMQDFTNTIGKQETLISLLMADPPMRKVRFAPLLQLTRNVSHNEINHTLFHLNPLSLRPRSARPTRPMGSCSAPSPSSKASRVARSHTRHSAPPSKPHARPKLRYVTVHTTKTAQ